MRSDNLLLEVVSGCGGVSSLVAWCPSRGLVATTHRSPQSSSELVSIFSPEAPDEKVVLRVPLEDPADCIITLQWSPLRCMRALLTATRKGLVFIWTQTEQKSSGNKPRTVNEWYGSKVMHAGASLALAKWLEPLPVYKHEKNRMEDRGKVSLDNLFVPVEVSQEDGLHWVKAGMLCLVVLESQGKLTFWSVALGPEFHTLDWRASPQVDLAPGGEIMCADIAVSRGKSLAIVYSSTVQPHALMLMRVKGDPFVDAPTGHLETTAVANTTLPVNEGQHITGLHLETSIPAMGILCGVQAEAGAGKDDARFFRLHQQGVSLVLIEDTPITCGAARVQQGPDKGFASARTPGSRLIYQYGHVFAPHGSSLLHRRRAFPMGAPPPWGCYSCPPHLRGLVCTAAALSPNQMIVAAVFCQVDEEGLDRLSSCVSSRLVLWRLAGVPQEESSVEMFALPMAWSLVNSHAHWDVVECVGRLLGPDLTGWDTKTDVDEQRRKQGVANVAAVLGRVDQWYHALTHDQRIAYSDAWDLLKRQVLLRLPGQEAEVILVDITTRQLMQHLYQIVVPFEAIAGALNTWFQKSSKSQDALKPAPLMTRCLMHWLDWRKEFLRLFAMCIKLHIAQGGGLGGSGRAPVIVPIVGLLADVRFLRSCLSSYTIFYIANKTANYILKKKAAKASEAAKVPEAALAPEAAMTEELDKLFKYIATAVNMMVKDKQPAQLVIPGDEAALVRYTSSRETHEDLGAFAELVKGAQGMCTQQLRLHYSKTCGALLWALDPDGLPLIEKHASLKTLPVPTLEEILEKCRSLGLLPQRNLHRIRGLLQRHCRFRAPTRDATMGKSPFSPHGRTPLLSRTPGTALPDGTDGQNVIMDLQEADEGEEELGGDKQMKSTKRKWHQQRQVAMGYRPLGLCDYEPRIDLLSGKRLEADDVWTYATLDSTGTTVEYEYPEGPINVAVNRRSWLFSAPTSGSGWKRTKLELEL